MANGTTAMASLSLLISSLGAVKGIAFKSCVHKKEKGGISGSTGTINSGFCPADRTLPFKAAVFSDLHDHFVYMHLYAFKYLQATLNGLVTQLESICIITIIYGKGHCQMVLYWLQSYEPRC